MLVLGYALLLGSASALNWHDLVNLGDQFVQQLQGRNVQTLERTPQLQANVWRPNQVEQLQYHIIHQDYDQDSQDLIWEYEDSDWINPNWMHPSLVQLAQQLNLTKCVEHLAAVGIDKVLNHEGWFTLFCPTNEAFAHEKFYPGEDILSNKMRIHVARGKFHSSDFGNEVIFSSLLSKRNIRMNVYEGGNTTIVTANGQQVVQSDHIARNGYLHVISGVMASVYDRFGSVISEIDDCCPQNSELVSLIKVAGMYEKMEEVNPITFLAPTNGAFTSLHPDFMIHLKKNVTLLRKILESHVIHGTWYTPGLFGGDNLKSWSGGFLNVQKTNTEIRFSDSRVLLSDISAGNGVTHIVDTLIIPKQVRRQIQNLLTQLYSN